LEVKDFNGSLVHKIFSNIRLILKIYAVIALIVAAVRSPLAFASIPIILLVWFLYQWRWPSSQLIDFLTQYFMFFAIGLVFSGIVGPYFACLIALPQVAAIDIKLRDIGRVTVPDANNGKRSITNIGIVTLSVTAGVILIGLMVWSVTLLLACCIIMIYLIALGLVIWFRQSSTPVIGETAQVRVIAGREAQSDIVLKRASKLKGMLFLQSRYPWCKIVPNAFIPLEASEISIKASVTPALAGPTEIKADACVIDPWGLSQVRFEIDMVKLVVIPRAQYADWLARKYLTGAKFGSLSLISNVGSIKPQYGLRRGVEFYGNRMYQPGDSLKNIDWKHSVKYNELVSKEFFEIQAQPVIILINLVANDIEETDKLAYNIIVASLSLAQDGIPAALAAYDDNGVIMTTSSLVGQELAVRSLEVVKEIITKESADKSLNPPDVSRLRANIRRLKDTESLPAIALRDLLQVEFKSLSLNAKSSPCTAALNEVLMKMNQQSTVVVISNHNHDADALAFNLNTLTSKGNTVISV
jgi:Protein of unknown function DUF58